MHESEERMIREVLFVIEERLRRIERILTVMAVDQESFDVALAAFLDDITTGVAAIQAKLEAAGTPVDLSAEMQSITDAKAAFDAVVASDTTTEAPPTDTTADQG